MALYGAIGPYGSGKSSMAVYFIKNASTFLGTNNYEIITNIKIEDEIIKNVHHMDDDKLLQVMRTVNFVNDLERVLYGYFKPGFKLVKRFRSKFKRYLVVLDESGTIHNNRLYKEFSSNYVKYVNQCRKLNMEIILCSVQGGENEKSLRSKVEFWFYVEPLIKGKFPILQNIGVIRQQVLDDEGKVKMSYHRYKDEFGNIKYDSYPIDYYYDWFYKPYTWDYYDDWYKNIIDDDKYIDLDFSIIKTIFKRDKQLLTAFKDSDIILPEGKKDFILE